MQFLIDVNEETPASLRLAASVLLIMAGTEAMTEDEIHAAARRPAQPAKPMHPAPPPIGKPAPVVAPPAPLPAGNEPVAPVQHPERHPDAPPPPPPADVPAGTELDPARVFGGAAPLAQGGTETIVVPPPPAAMVPAAPAAPLAAASDAGNTSATTTPPALTAGERDGAGMPWDARVHSETKKKNADGTWRFRRNLDAAVKDAVMAELKASYGQQVIPSQSPAVVAGAVPVPAAPSAVPQPPAAATAVPPPPAPAAGPVPAPPAEDNGVRYVGDTPTVIPQPPASTAVPVPPAPAVGVSHTGGPAVLPAVTSFRDLMQKVNVALAGGKLTQAQLVEACKSAGAEGITQLAAQPMLVPTVDSYLNRWLAAA